MSGPSRMALAGLPVLAAISGCTSLQVAEPIMHPPAHFRSGAVVPVEFVDVGAVGVRCAERGVKFLGLPGLNSLACSNADLVTMPNPCQFENAGWYAEAMCHELAHVNGWPASHDGGRYLRQPQTRAIDEASTEKPEPGQKAS